MCVTTPAWCEWSIIHFVFICLATFFRINNVFNNPFDFLIEIIIILLGFIPIIFIQLKLGGMLKKSLYGIFHSYFPALRGVAVACVVQLFSVQLRSTSFAVDYICLGIATASGEREMMASCNNSWNNEISCESDKPSSAVEEYMRYRFYQNEGTTFDDLGGFPDFPTFPLVLTLTMIIVFLCVCFGPRVFAWSVSILGAIVVLIMIGLLIYGWNEIADRGVPAFEAREIHPIEMEKTFRWQIASLAGYVTIPIWSGILPTLGRFTDGGKVFRNTSWIVLVAIAVGLQVLATFTIKPYRTTSERSLGFSWMYSELIVDFIKSESPATASFFYCLSIYLVYISEMSLYLLVMVDNCLEGFDWLIKKRGSNRRVSWFITTAVISCLGILLSLPTVTRGRNYVTLVLGAGRVMGSFVLTYFMGLGIIAIYIWQNVATAEKMVFGIWAFLVLIIFVMTALLDFLKVHYYHFGYPSYVGLSERSDMYKRWRATVWSLAAIPWAIIGVGKGIFGLHFIYTRMERVEAWTGCPNRDVRSDLSDACHDNELATVEPDERNVPEDQTGSVATSC